MDRKLTKSAGEHWVCAVMSQLGWAVALTRDGLEHTDILGVHSETRALVEVQVKAASYAAAPNWRVNRKAQEPGRSEHEWFVFVALPARANELPRSFVVPRDHVAAAAVIGWKNWRYPETPPKRSRTGTGLEQSRLHDYDLKGYEDRWDLLERSASDAPILLPPSFREAALRVDVTQELSAAGHPWATQLPAW